MKTSLALCLLLARGSAAVSNVADASDQNYSVLDNVCPVNSSCMDGYENECNDGVEYCECDEGYGMADNICVPALIANVTNGVHEPDPGHRALAVYDLPSNHEEEKVPIDDLTVTTSLRGKQQGNNHVSRRAGAAGVAAGAAVASAVVSAIQYLIDNDTFSGGDADAARRAAVDRVYYSPGGDKYNIVCFDYGDYWWTDWGKDWKWLIEPIRKETAFASVKIEGRTHGIYAFQGHAILSNPSFLYYRGYWARSYDPNIVYFQDSKLRSYPFWLRLSDNPYFQGRGAWFGAHWPDSCINAGNKFNDVASSATWSSFTYVRRVCFYQHDKCQGKVRCWDGSPPGDSYPNHFGVDGIDNMVTSFKVIW